MTKQTDNDPFPLTLEQNFTIESLKREFSEDSLEKYSKDTLAELLIKVYTMYLKEKNVSIEWKKVVKSLKFNGSSVFIYFIGSSVLNLFLIGIILFS